MISTTSKVYTPTVVKDLQPPVYRPPVVPEAVPKPPPPVHDMYLTKEDTEEGTIWKLNVVSDNEQKYEYTLYVHWD